MEEAQTIRERGTQPWRTPEWSVEAEGVRQTKYYPFLGSQTLLAQALEENRMECHWVRTPVGDQKLWEVARIGLGLGDAGTQTRAWEARIRLAHRWKTAPYLGSWPH